MNPLNKARELAIAIKKSKEYNELKKLEEIINSNNRYKECYEYCLENKNSKDFDKDELDIVNKYILARENFNNMMRDINTIISFSIGYIRESGNCSKCNKCK